MKKYFSSYWLRSAFYTILQRFSITFFGLINVMVLIRTLSKSQMGVWFIFLAVTSIFEMTKSGLLKNAHIRYVSTSEDHSDKTAIASSSLLINAAITLLFVLFLLLFADVLSHWMHTGKELADMLYWFIPGLIAMVFFSHLEAIQQSFLDFKGVFAGYFVRQFAFFLVILTLTVFHIPFTLSQLAFYQSLCFVVGTVVLYFYTRPYLHHRFDPSWLWLKRIVGYGGYIFSSGVVANVFSNLDQFMTGRFMTTADVAYYSVASRINLLIDIPSYAAADVIFPKVSKASATEGEGKVRYLFERMVALLLCFTIPLAIFVIIFPKLFIFIVAGKGYGIAAFILQLYMLDGILRPMQNQSANLLNSIGRSGLCFVINAVSLAANLVINYSCMRYFGFYGAAIGTTITCILGMTAWYIIMRRLIGANLASIWQHMLEHYRNIYRFAYNLVKKS